MGGAPTTGQLDDPANIVNIVIDMQRKSDHAAPDCVYDAVLEKMLRQIFDFRIVRAVVSAAGLANANDGSQVRPGFSAVNGKPEIQQSSDEPVGKFGDVRFDSLRANGCEILMDSRQAAAAG